ncbi:MAG TPA: vitamin K epoxide reductase family protein [Terriglobales bacterium]|nr:vitamin K epoxide reductase family protein [Terriglobales bacterium]
MTETAKWLSVAIAILAFAGVAVSGVALHNHYGHDKTSFCEIGQNFDCDIVNRSSYSSIAGIPVALIGILGYAALAALATVYRSKAETPALLFAGGLAGLGFALYLTYVEAYVLATWCILCLSSLVLISLITTLSAVRLAHWMRKA